MNAQIQTSTAPSFRLVGRLECWFDGLLAGWEHMGGEGEGEEDRTEGCWFVARLGGCAQQQLVNARLCR